MPGSRHDRSRTNGSAKQHKPATGHGTPRLSTSSGAFFVPSDRLSRDPAMTQESLTQTWRDHFFRTLDAHRTARPCRMPLCRGGSGIGPGSSPGRSWRPAPPWGGKAQREDIPGRCFPSRRASTWPSTCARSPNPRQDGRSPWPCSSSRTRSATAGSATRSGRCSASAPGAVRLRLSPRREPGRRLGRPADRVVLRRPAARGSAGDPGRDHAGDRQPGRGGDFSLWVFPELDPEHEHGEVREGLRLRFGPSLIPASVHCRIGSAISVAIEQYRSAATNEMPTEDPDDHGDDRSSRRLLLSLAQIRPGNSRARLRQAAAIQWYSQGLISQGKAAEIAGLKRSEFLEALDHARIDACQVTSRN